MNKRGISPLAATVLLIAFSVSLGAVVMSWGETYVEQKAEFVQGVREVQSGCDAATISVVSINGVPQICHTGTVFEAIVDNGPTVDLYDLHARVVGSDGIYNKESTLEAPVAKNDAAKIRFAYNNVGTVRSLKLTPKIMSGDKVIFCTKAAVELTSIPAC